MAKIYDKYPALMGKDPDVRSRRYITPTRIVWTSREDGADIRGEENLLLARSEQITLGVGENCTMVNTSGKPKASILVDYGMEIHGTVRIMIWAVTGAGNRANIRVRRGESVMEAMTDLGEKNTTNDHANRDEVINVGFYSAMELNESGFRFMRLDLLDEDATLVLKSVNATFIFRDIDYKGSFDCSDPLLNKIWDTAAYTAHLNMQEYLWDGIKRDRLVWIGDMHTEVMTIITAFGYNEVVPKSLDLVRNETPVGTWMNGISSYSVWWLMIHYDWYMAFGNRAYLEEQRDYLKGLMTLLASYVDEDGIEHMPEGRFLDWPNNDNPKAIHAGLQGVLRLALQYGGHLLSELGETELAAACSSAAARMANHCPDPDGSKQAAAMLVLSGLADAKQMNEDVIAVGGAKGFSTFMGYYTLKAKALAGDYTGALHAMRDYWGGMLKMGATTFWEDFSLDWMENAAPITEIVPEGKIDIHGDWGAYCYIKFRHSLCHGWASGPCPYMTQYVLGIRIEEKGCKKIRIAPELGDLSYAKGTFPTPYGVLTVSHTKNTDGTIHTEVTAPKEIEILY